MTDEIKLHLGCGERRIPNYINVDIRETATVDLVADITNLPYDNNSVDLIYSCANIEHFGRREWIGVLEHWYALLKPGGVLRLSTADFSAVCNEYIKNKNISSLLGLVVGGQNNKYDWHGMVFDYELLEEELIKIGFKSIKKYDWKKTEHAHIDDYSSAYLPHMDKENGTLMMLNIEAIK
jgi:predicted SAM-dependent methyltransferase